MVICENRKVLWYCAIGIIALVFSYYFIDLKRLWYKLVLHMFYFVCDMLKLLMKLVELY